MAHRRSLLLFGLSIAVAFFFPSANSASPSFNCSKAQKWSEVAVCNNARLADLDVQVAAHYRSAREQLTGAKRDRVKNDQRAWLRQREGCKGSSNEKDCLLDVYNSRIAQLASVRSTPQAASGNGDIKAIDFRNFTYHLGNTACAKAFGSSTVEVHDGEFGDFRDTGFSISADRIVYGDLTGDGQDEAAVITYCGGMHPTEQAFIYEMKEGRAVLLSRLEPGSRADGGIVRPYLCQGCGNGISIQDGVIAVERMHGKAACCPEYVAVTGYRWDGQRLAQVGEEQRRKYEKASAQDTKVTSSASADARTLTVDGKIVSYWPPGQDKLFAEFAFSSKKHRNTYSIDCAAKRFRWTENRSLSTGKVTGNAAGAEWKAMNPRSTISNAVYGAFCPQAAAVAGASGQRGAMAGGKPFDTASASSKGTERTPVEVEVHTVEGEVLAINHPRAGGVVQIRSQGQKYGFFLDTNAQQSRDDWESLLRTLNKGDSIAVEYKDQLYEAFGELSGGALLARRVPTSSASSGGALTTGQQVSTAGDTAMSQGRVAHADRISMKEGSTLSGKIKGGNVPFESSFGEVDVKLDDVRSYAEGTLTLADGTVLKGMFEGEEIEIETSVGKLEVDASEIVWIARGGVENKSSQTLGRSGSDQPPSRSQILEDWEVWSKATIAKSSSGCKGAIIKSVSIDRTKTLPEKGVMLAYLNVTGEWVGRDDPQSDGYNSTLPCGKIKDYKKGDQTVERIMIYEKFDTGWRFNSKRVQ